MQKLRQIRERKNLRREATVWSESSSLPFTKRHAVTGRSLGSPAHLFADPHLNLVEPSSRRSHTAQWSRRRFEQAFAHEL